MNHEEEPVPASLDATRLIDQLCNLKVWRKGDKRAPHKPLLVLLALARVQRGENRLVGYEDIATSLADLIRTYGPTGNVQPELPFWYLQYDGIWELPKLDTLRAATSHLKQQKHIPPKYLIDGRATAGFTGPIYGLLCDRPDLVNMVAHRVLDANFPPSLHEDILDQVGMPWVSVRKKRPRDPKFRELIIRAYEHRCALCGYDGQLRHSLLGLEAAHVKWHSQGGPDTADNGLALCSFHHKAFDRGAFSLNDDLEILVSQHVHGGPVVTELLLQFVAKPLRRPQPAFEPPKPEFIRWHRSEVFQEPQR